MTEAPSRNILLSAFVPANVLAGMSSIVHRYRESSVQVCLLVADNPALNDASFDALSRLFHDFAEGLQIKNVHLLRGDTFSKEIYHPNDLPGSISRFKKYLAGITGVDSFDELIIPHDVVGSVNRLLALCYKQAQITTCGDAFGVVGERDFVLSLIQSHSLSGYQKLKRAISRIYKTVSSPFKQKPPPVPSLPEIRFDLASLILPTDDSGTFLQKTKLSVVPKEVAKSIIHRVGERLPDIWQYDPLAGFPGERVLFNLTNLTEAGYLTMEEEVGLCLEIIYTHVKPGSAILLKPHPLAWLPLASQMAGKLATDFRVEIFEQKLNRYPIELFLKIAQNYRILAISGSAASLRYLCGSTAEYVLDERLVRKWFPRQSWSMYLHACALYKGQMANLERWDGSSVLWTQHARACIPREEQQK